MKWNVLLFDEIVSLFKADESKKVTAEELLDAGLIKRKVDQKEVKEW